MSPGQGCRALFQKYDLTISILPPSPHFSCTPSLYTHSGSPRCSQPGPQTFVSSTRPCHWGGGVPFLMAGASHLLSSLQRPSLCFRDSETPLWSLEFLQDVFTENETRATRSEIEQLGSWLNSPPQDLPKVLGPRPWDPLAMSSTKFHVKLSLLLFKKETIFFGIK